MGKYNPLHSPKLFGRLSTERLLERWKRYKLRELDLAPYFSRGAAWEIGGVFFESVSDEVPACRLVSQGVYDLGGETGVAKAVRLSKDVIKKRRKIEDLLEARGVGFSDEAFKARCLEVVSEHAQRTETLSANTLMSDRSELLVGRSVLGAVRFKRDSSGRITKDRIPNVSPEAGGYLGLVSGAKYGGVQDAGTFSHTVLGRLFVGILHEIRGAKQWPDDGCAKFFTDELDGQVGGDAKSNAGLLAWKDGCKEAYLTEFKSVLVLLREEFGKLDVRVDAQRFQTDGDYKRAVVSMFCDRVLPDIFGKYEPVFRLVMERHYREGVEVTSKVNFPYGLKLERNGGHLDFSGFDKAVARTFPGVSADNTVWERRVQSAVNCQLALRSQDADHYFSQLYDVMLGIKGLGDGPVKKAALQALKQAVSGNLGTFVGSAIQGLEAMGTTLPAARLFALVDTVGCREDLERCFVGKYIGFQDGSSKGALSYMSSLLQAGGSTRSVGEDVYKRGADVVAAWSRADAAVAADRVPASPPSYSGATHYGLDGRRIDTFSGSGLPEGAGTGEYVEPRVSQSLATTATSAHGGAASRRVPEKGNLGPPPPKPTPLHSIKTREVGVGDAPAVVSKRRRDVGAPPPYLGAHVTRDGREILTSAAPWPFGPGSSGLDTTSALTTGSVAPSPQVGKGIEDYFASRGLEEVSEHIDDVRLTLERKFGAPSAVALSFAQVLNQDWGAVGRLSGVVSRPDFRTFAEALGVEGGEFGQFCSRLANRVMDLCSAGDDKGALDGVAALQRLQQYCPDDPTRNRALMALEHVQVTVLGGLDAPEFDLCASREERDAALDDRCGYDGDGTAYARLAVYTEVARLLLPEDLKLQGTVRAVSEQRWGALILGDSGVSFGRWVVDSGVAAVLKVAGDTGDEQEAFVYGLGGYVSHCIAKGDVAGALSSSKALRAICLNVRGTLQEVAYDQLLSVSQVIEDYYPGPMAALQRRFGDASYSEADLETFVQSSDFDQDAEQVLAILSEYKALRDDCATYLTTVAAERERGGGSWAGSVSGPGTPITPAPSTVDVAGQSRSIAELVKAFVDDCDDRAVVSIPDDSRVFDNWYKGSTLDQAFFGRFKERLLEVARKGGGELPDEVALGVVVALGRMEDLEGTRFGKKPGHLEKPIVRGALLEVCARLDGLGDSRIKTKTQIGVLLSAEPPIFTVQELGKKKKELGEKKKELGEKKKELGIPVVSVMPPSPPLSGGSSSPPGERFSPGERVPVKLGERSATVVVPASVTSVFSTNSAASAAYDAASEASSEEGGPDEKLPVRWKKGVNVSAGTSASTAVVTAPSEEGDVVPSFMASIGLDREAVCGGVANMQALSDNVEARLRAFIQNNLDLSQALVWSEDAQKVFFAELLPRGLNDAALDMMVRHLYEGLGMDGAAKPGSLWGRVVEAAQDGKEWGELLSGRLVPSLAYPNTLNRITAVAKGVEAEWIKPDNSLETAHFREWGYVIDGLGEVLNKDLSAAKGSTVSGGFDAFVHHVVYTLAISRRYAKPYTKEEGRAYADMIGEALQAYYDGHVAPSADTIDPAALYKNAQQFVQEQGGFLAHLRDIQNKRLDVMVNYLDSGLATGVLGVGNPDGKKADQSDIDSARAYFVMERDYVRGVDGAFTAANVEQKWYGYQTLKGLLSFGQEAPRYLRPQSILARVASAPSVPTVKGALGDDAAVVVEKGDGGDTPQATVSVTHSPARKTLSAVGALVRRLSPFKRAADRTGASAVEEVPVEKDPGLMQQDRLAASIKQQVTAAARDGQSLDAYLTRDFLKFSDEVSKNPLLVDLMVKWIHSRPKCVERMWNSSSPLSKEDTVVRFAVDGLPEMINNMNIALKRVKQGYCFAASGDTESQRQVAALTGPLVSLGVNSVLNTETQPRWENLTVFGKALVERINALYPFVLIEPESDPSLFIQELSAGALAQHIKAAMDSVIVDGVQIVGNEQRLAQQIVDRCADELAKRHDAVLGVLGDYIRSGLGVGALIQHGEGGRHKKFTKMEDCVAEANWLDERYRSDVWLGSTKVMQWRKAHDVETPVVLEEHVAEAEVDGPPMLDDVNATDRERLVACVTSIVKGKKSSESYVNQLPDFIKQGSRFVSFVKTTAGMYRGDPDGLVAAVVNAVVERRTDLGIGDSVDLEVSGDVEAVDRKGVTLVPRADERELRSYQELYGEEGIHAVVGHKTSKDRQKFKDRLQWSRAATVARVDGGAVPASVYDVASIGGARSQIYMPFAAPRDMEQAEVMWQALLGQGKARVVVSLTQEDEDNKKRDYIPSGGSLESHHIGDRDTVVLPNGVEITCGAVEDAQFGEASGKLRKYMVYPVGGDSYEIQHLTYKEWPDHGVAPAAVLVDLAYRVDEQLVALGDPNGGVAANCFFGFGRTNTLFMVHQIKRQMEEAVWKAAVDEGKSSLELTVDVAAMRKAIRSVVADHNKVIEDGQLALIENEVVPLLRERVLGWIKEVDGVRSDFDLKVNIGAVDLPGTGRDVASSVGFSEEGASPVVSSRSSSDGDGSSRKGGGRIGRRSRVSSPARVPEEGASVPLHTLVMDHMINRAEFVGLPEDYYAGRVGEFGAFVRQKMSPKSYKKWTDHVSSSEDLCKLGVKVIFTLYPFLAVEGSILEPKEFDKTRELVKDVVLNALKKVKSSTSLDGFLKALDGQLSSRDTQFAKQEYLNVRSVLKTSTNKREPFSCEGVRSPAKQLWETIFCKHYSRRPFNLGLVSDEERAAASSKTPVAIAVEVLNKAADKDVVKTR